MLDLNQISIIFPNGNERILGRQIEISWQRPYISSFDRSGSKEIEIFFTDNYIDDQKTSWSRIARVPYTAEKFIWNFGDRFRSDNCRVAIRTVDSSGKRTILFKSAANFSIFKSVPRSPSVISPSRNMRYSNTVPIILDYQDVIDSSSNRDRVFIYYRSIKKSIPLTAIKERVAIGTGPINWDVSDLPNSDDYELVAFSSDDYGRRSNEVVINNISIFNEGYFIRDFFPPEGFMVINDGDDYTSDTRVRAKLFTYDESTGIHGVKFSELSSEAPHDEISVSSPQFYSESMITNVKDEDGRGVLSAIIQDFGGNRSDPQEESGLFLPPQGKRNFRSLFDTNSTTEIVDLLSTPPSGGEDFGSIHFITSGDKFSLFEMPRELPGAYVELAALPIECNLIAKYSEVIYLSGISSTRNLNLLRYNGTEVEVVYSLSDTESEITAMKQLGSSLYVGCLNGDIYKFDGSSLVLDSNVGGPPSHMLRVGSQMYILVKNINSFYIHNGSSITKLDMESNIIN